MYCSSSNICNSLILKHTLKLSQPVISLEMKICKSNVLKAVTKLSGIDQVSVDAEKGLLTVVGNVDPVLIVKKVRKIGKAAEVVSIGPPKPEPKKSPKSVLLPPYCNDCQLVRWRRLYFL
ncbi:heavy metal-associated isoprenylated plant protein 2 [Ziziphus jujuba]|uniref:Heavy metal-associated isoprenylated plant protein 2 n=1 Tax=Ziziphus jujuba TaxID=326968 RepID=A0A6P6G7Y1_ZIZJJ|nr:heavy metal-associated isoprenylated plant protein 2 [Ziziphus jujuba]